MEIVISPSTKKSNIDTMPELIIKKTASFGDSNYSDFIHHEYYNLGIDKDKKYKKYICQRNN